MSGIQTLFKSALMAAGLILPANAQYNSGSIEFYSFDNFSGRSGQVAQETSQLGFSELGDDSRSIRVYGGNWIACRDAYYAGPCLYISQDVPSLAVFGMSDAISSVMPAPYDLALKHGSVFARNPAGGFTFFRRETSSTVSPFTATGSAGYEPSNPGNYSGGYGNDSSGYNQGNSYGNTGGYNPPAPPPDAPPYTGPRNPALIVYEDNDYGGAAFGTNRDVTRLWDYDFDNEISSVEIIRGEWEFCTSNDFRGDCTILTADETRLYAIQLDNRISSIREVPVGTLARREEEERLRREEEARLLREALARADVIVYVHSDFGGRAYPVEGDISGLGNTGMNDEISSIQVRRGTWEVCTNGDYRGRCETITSDMPRLNSIRMNDNISSIRRVS